MYIKEFEEIEIVITTRNSKIWTKKLGYTPKINEPLKIHWSLANSSSFRTQCIKLQCDDCAIIYERRIKDLKIEETTHYCIACKNKGNRNGMFGKPCSKQSKEGLKKFFEKHGNPFTWESTKKKIREANVWEKAAKSNTGKKRSKEQRKKQSEAALQAFKDGRRVPSKRWGKTIVQQYNGIDYQSSYELKFLQLAESYGLLTKIKRGPHITYKDENNKKHTYFVDYQLQDSNIIFEIKSSFIWSKHIKTNELKQKAAKKKFNYILIIDNRFNKTKKIFELWKKNLKMD